MSLQSIRIKSGQGDYDVEFPQTLAEVAQAIRGFPKAVLVVDRNIQRLYEEDLGPLFAAMPTIFLAATEEEKSLAGVTKVVSWLQELGANKQTVVVTFGGGILQDISALAAHLYYRGLKWIFVPTTLLSMSDSCIGAKCGVNLNQFKNQLGCFHSPARVLICTKFVETLTDHDVASGYGEILKLAVTGSPAHLERLEAAVAEGGLRNPRLASLIRDCLEVKKAVIEVDEYEKDLRRILNYGHTFGHALESATHHEVPHGLAVAWGMDLVNFIALRGGLLTESDYQTVRNFIRKHLPCKVSSPVSAAELIQGSRRDKKVADGQINLILLERIGSLKIVKTPFDAALESLITEYIERHDAFRC